MTGSGRARAARSRQNLVVLLRRYQNYLTDARLPIWPISPLGIALFLSSHLDDANSVLKRTLASYRSDLQGLEKGTAHVWRGTPFELNYTGLDLLKDVVAHGRMPVKNAGKKRGRTAEIDNEEPAWCHCRQPENGEVREVSEMILTHADDSLRGSVLLDRLVSRGLPRSGR